MKKLLSFLLFLVTASVFAVENNYGFTYQNEAINPACVAMFDSSLADFPYIKSINITVCQHSNAAYQKTLYNAQSGTYYYENDKDISQGRYGYKVIGKTANGIYVLSTYSDSGGSGNFTNLLLVRLNNSKLYVVGDNSKLNNQTITQLNLLGYVRGGDRCTGSFADIKISANLVKIKKYTGDNPIDCNKTKEFTIDLSKIESS